MEAARLLRDALGRGDSTAVGGLLLLDPEGGPAEVRDALRRLPPENGARVTAAGTLLVRSPDPALQDELVRSLDDPSPAERRLALNYLAQSAPNRTLVSALRGRVRAETDGANRALGAELLLHWSGAIARLEESYRRYGPVLEALESGRPGQVGCAGRNRPGAGGGRGAPGERLTRRAYPPAPADVDAADSATPVVMVFDVPRW